MQTISTIAELDAKLAECDAAARISDDAMRKVFTGFRMHQPHDAPTGPFSEEYARYQLVLYERLAGKPYRVENEATHFSIDDAVRRPFPFSTGSCATTGDQLAAIGALLKRMQLRPARGSWSLARAGETRRWPWQRWDFASPPWTSRADSAS